MEECNSMNLMQVVTSRQVFWKLLPPGRSWELNFVALWQGKEVLDDDEALEDWLNDRPLNGRPRLIFGDISGQRWWHDLLGWNVLNRVDRCCLWTGQILFGWFDVVFAGGSRNWKHMVTGRKAGGGNSWSNKLWFVCTSQRRGLAGCGWMRLVAAGWLLLLTYPGQAKGGWADWSFRNTFGIARCCLWCPIHGAGEHLGNPPMKGRKVRFADEIHEVNPCSACLQTKTCLMS